MLIRTKSPAENRLHCDSVWGYFNLFSYNLIQTWGSFSLLTSVGFILILLWYELLYLWAISLRKSIYLLLLFLVNYLNTIPLIERLKRSTILAFRSENVAKNLIWYFFKNFLYLRIQKFGSFISLDHDWLLFVCSNNLVSTLFNVMTAFWFQG